MEFAFNPNELTTVASEICSIYASKQVQKWYTASEWYHVQIQNKIQQPPNMKPIACWNWLEHTKYYTQDMFNKKCNQIKKKNNKLTNSKPRSPTTSPQHKRTFANKFAELSDSNINVIIR